MFEMFHNKNCQDQSKSVIHLLSLKEHFFMESHAVIHSISKFITHQVLSMNRKRYPKSKLGTSALVISKQESRPFRDLLPLIFFHGSQTKPTQKLQHPPSGRSCTIAPNCASIVKDTHKQQMAFHHYMQSVLESSACLFPVPWKRDAAWSTTFLQSCISSPLSLSRLLPLTLAETFPVFKPFPK